MTTLYQTPFLATLRQNDLQKAIHKPHWQERQQIIEALAAVGFKPYNTAANRLAACGQVARLWLDPTVGKVRSTVTRCGQRLCPWCTHHRTARAKRQIIAIMATLKDPRHFVLTARSNNTPLPAQLVSLRAAFHKLRRCKDWRSRVTGGVYTVEITWNSRLDQWHPHVHIIAGGDYFPQGLLAKLWKAATGDSDIVWIKKADNAPKAAMELAGYIGKPPKVKELPDTRLREYFLTTKGTRMLQTFGNCRSAPATDDDPQLSPPDPARSFTVNRIRFLALRDCQAAVTLADLISRRWPWYAPYLHPLQTDTPPPGSGPDHAAAEILDAKIFLAFNDLLAARDLGDLDLYDHFPGPGD